MKTTESKRGSIFTVIRIMYISILVFHLLLLLARGAFAQPLHLSQQQGKVRAIYTSQVGIREKQPNSGREVEGYLRYVGLEKGNPWCAAFVCWVYGKAGIPNPRTGWSPALFAAKKVIWIRGAATGTARPAPQSLAARYPQPATQLPATGDVFGIYFPDKGRIAHVGFVDEWTDPWVVTVEGNTNIAGSREGDGVYRKRRLARSIYQVARYMN